MSVDQAAVRRIAHLARIAVTDAEVPHLQNEINAILAFVEALNAVDVVRRRADDVGHPDETADARRRSHRRRDRAAILANAPLAEDGFFRRPQGHRMTTRLAASPA